MMPKSSGEKGKKWTKNNNKLFITHSSPTHYFPPSPPLAINVCNFYYMPLGYPQFGN
jgi:hypothetical protein